MRPELEQPAAALATPGQSVEMGAVVVSEPREQRQIVGARQHVDRIDLQEAQPVDGALHMAEICRTVGPLDTETLGRQRNAPSGGG